MLSRRTQYNHCESAIIGVLVALARTRHCQVVVDSNEIIIVHQGKATQIGAITVIQGMTVKSLMDIFEEAREDIYAKTHTEVTACCIGYQCR